MPAGTSPSASAGSSRLPPNAPVANRGMLALGVSLATVIFFLCFPAMSYRVAMWVPAMLPHALLRKMPPMSWFVVFIADCFFIVVLAGRPLCALAIILDAVLLFLRGVPVWLKLLASAFIVFAIFGTLLVEAQASHVRK